MKQKNSSFSAFGSAISAPALLLPAILVLGVLVAFSIVPEHLFSIADATLKSLIAVMLFWTVLRALDTFSHLHAKQFRKRLFGQTRMIVFALQGLCVITGVTIIAQFWGVPATFVLPPVFFLTTVVLLIHAAFQSVKGLFEEQGNSLS